MLFFFSWGGGAIRVPFFMLFRFSNFILEVHDIIFALNCLFFIFRTVPTSHPSLQIFDSPVCVEVPLQHIFITLRPWPYNDEYFTIVPLRISMPPRVYYTWEHNEEIIPADMR